MANVIRAKWTWTGGRFERDVAVVIDSQGRIERVERAGAVDLLHHALLPGFVNAHSHAFQRGLRGTPQRFGTNDNFWSWRETMYRLAESLDVDRFYETSKRCFEEMLAAGITCVGEFHYLHHENSRWALDDAILAAAKDAGIRLVLLQTYYATGGIGKPLEGAQLRFGPGSRDEFVRQLDVIAAKLDSKMQSLGVACHSIRAAPTEDLVYFRDYARANGNLPFHIHVEEVRQEITDCVAAHGKGPLETLLDRIHVDDRVTAIHCTHSTPDDLREFTARGGRICLCPLTEGNLSDGIADVPTMIDAGGRLCVGSDSNIRLGMTEELRWLEFVQRVARERRGVMTNLIDVGTVNGAGALGVACGVIAPGHFADLFVIDLDHPTMRGCAEPDAIIDSLIYGCGNEPITQVWVSGVGVSPAHKRL